MDLNEDGFDDSEFDFEKHKQAIASSRRCALHAVKAMNMPQQVIVSSESFAGLGLGLKSTAERRLTALSDTYGEKLPDLIGIALRECHYAVCKGAFYCGSIGSNPSISTPEGYAQMEGWANAMYNSLADLKEDAEQIAFRIDTPVVERVSSQVLLDCIALYWLSEASKMNRSGDSVGAQDWIFEGLDALNLSNGIVMWDAAFDFGREESAEKEKAEVDDARTILARIGANARHAENRSMKTDVFLWLDVNMVNFKSMDGAAAAITKQQPIAFRTAQKWVGDWKKNVR